MTLTLGLVSIFVDVKQNRKARLAVAVIMVLSTLGTVVNSYYDNKAKQADSERAARDRAAASEKEDRLLSIASGEATTITALQSNTGDIKNDIAGLMKKFGISPDAPITEATIKTSIAADKVYRQLLPTVASEDRATPRVVTYFPKNVDTQIVLAALRSGNFEVQLGKGNPNNANLPTNAVWVGNNISVADAKFVAATLIRAGVPIASVKRLANGENARASLIEVGTDARLAGHPSMTIDQLNALTESNL